MTSFTCFLIDPLMRTITEVQHNGTRECLYAHLLCDAVDAASINDRDVLYLDDEGMYAIPAAFFTIVQPHLEGLEQIFVGRALAVGTNRGEDAPPSITLAELVQRVCFRTRDEVLEIAKVTGQ
jgi:hypothetical protein